MQFFSDINFKSYPLTNEIYEQLCIFYEKNKEIRKSKEIIRNEFQITRKLPKLEPLTYVSQKRESDKHKERFLKEWYDTLQNLRDIGDRIATDQFRPKWINSTTPKGVQADQFLHAFYYSQVKEGTRARHWEFFEKNKGNIEIALVDAMEWWASLESPPYSEDITINKWSIFLREKLQKDSLISISKEQFVEVCSYVHAMRDHSLRVSYKSYGLSEPLPQMELEDRIKYLAKWLFDRKSIEGKSVIDTLNYVLYGGEKDQIPERLWEATNSPKWRIPHLGISSIGEIIGWALPTDFPPRNGRTSKALTSLGYNVVIHSE